jgi:hypothetical protein
MDQPYDYVPLLDNEIRILEILPGEADDRIECRMQTVSLEDAPAYGALSYVWGEDKTARPIWVDGKRLSVWPNLEAALLEFRREPPILNPDSKADRVRHFSAAMQTIVPDILRHPPPFFNDNWHQMMAAIDSCNELLSLVAHTGSDIGMEVWEPSEGGEDWALMIEKFSQIETLAKEFTHPNSPPWLVRQPRYLWIDAICINQQDIAERNSQTRFMGEIYLKSFVLVVWLGIGQDSSDLAFKALSAFTHDFRALQRLGGMEEVVYDSAFDKWMNFRDFSAGFQDKIRHAIVQLFDRPWFTRGWIRQEYILGSLELEVKNHRVLFACGTSRARNLIEVANPMLSQWMRYKTSSQLYLSNSTFAGFLNADSIAMARNRFEVALSEKGGPVTANDKERGTALLKLMVETRSFHTSDPRDKIYSALGLFQKYFGMRVLDPLPAGLFVDYSAPIQAVFSTFMKWIVECTKKLHIFIFWSGPHSNHVKVSWCPDWSVDSSRRIQYGCLGVDIEIGNFDWPEDLSFDATPGSLCQVNFSETLDSITVHGLVWDVLLEYPVSFSKPDSLYETIVHDSKNQQFRKDVTHRACQRLIAFVQERTVSQPPGVFFAKILEALMYTAQFDQQKILEFQTWCWSNVLNEEPAQCEDSARDTPQDDFLQRNSGLEEINTAEPGTTLVLTQEHNVVRPFYDMTQPGDLICVILGCPIPMMLRPVEEHFELVGPVYVPGIMHGEAMTALQEKKVELQAFELH